MDKEEWEAQVKFCANILIPFIDSRWRVCLKERNIDKVVKSYNKFKRRLKRESVTQIKNSKLKRKKRRIFNI